MYSCLPYVSGGKVTYGNNYAAIKTNYGTTGMMITKKGDYDEHHGYIRVACSLLSEDFKFNEILLAFQHVPYTHTAEKLQENAKGLSYPNIHIMIQDISTRWNSSFHSWRGLIDLQSAIAHLPFKLLADLNNDNKKDLKWILMNELVQIFGGFEELIRKFKPMLMDEEDDEEETDKLITAVPGSKGDFNITRTIDTNDLNSHFKTLLLSIDKY
nr:15675_t:CDS:2 [Entrophospora candida]